MNTGVPLTWLGDGAYGRTAAAGILWRGLEGAQRLLGLEGERTSMLNGTAQKLADALFGAIAEHMGDACRKGPPAEMLVKEVG